MTFRKPWASPLFPVSRRDFLVTAAILLCALILCFILRQAGSIGGFASPVFVLAVLLISRLTSGYLYGLAAVVLGVVCVNFIFTYPYWAFNLDNPGYPVTFFTLLMISLITCTLTAQAKRQAQLLAESEREKMRADLLRSVSHDIRTPLTSIVGSTSAVLENPGLSPREQRELLENAREEAQWLIRVVENLLSITRMGGGQVSIAKEPEPAEEILGAAAQKFRRRFPQVSVAVSVPDELVMVPMDPILIGQVLANLLENAAIHGGAGPASPSGTTAGASPRTSWTASSTAASAPAVPRTGTGSGTWAWACPSAGPSSWPTAGPSRPGTFHRGRSSPSASPPPIWLWRYRHEHPGKDLDRGG